MLDGFTGLRQATVAITLGIAVVLAGCTSSTTTSQVAMPGAGIGTGMPSPFLGGNLADVSCAGLTLCAAVGSTFDPNPTSAVIATSADGGLTWRAATSDALSSTRFSSVSCAETVCLTVGRSLKGALVYSFSKDGSSWNTSTPIPGNGLAQSVGCAAVRWCLAISGDSSHVWSSITLDRGKSWATSGPLPPGTGSIVRVSCSSPMECIAVGLTTIGGPLIVTTNDGANSWSASALPPSVTSVLSASCRADRTCMAIAGTSSSGATASLVSHDGGSTFTASPVIPAIPGPLAVSCTSTACVTVGKSAQGAGVASVVVGARAPISMELRYVPNPMLSVSCPEMTRCIGATTASLVVMTPLVPKRSH